MSIISFKNLLTKEIHTGPVLPFGTLKSIKNTYKSTHNSQCLILWVRQWKVTKIFSTSLPFMAGRMSTGANGSITPITPQYYTSFRSAPCPVVMRLQSSEVERRAYIQIVREQLSTGDGDEKHA